MTGQISRRKLMEAAGVAALAPPLSAAASVPGPRFEGPDTPKICLSIGDGGPTPETARRIKQLGGDHVLSGGPPIPWEAARLRRQMDQLKANGVTPGNLMIAGFNNAIYARPGRGEDIDKVIRTDH